MSNLFIITRSVEIVFSMIIGAFLCWLGYLLFKTSLYEKSDMKVEIKKIKLILRASPGIFFSLFGTLIIALSVFNIHSYKSTKVLENGSKEKLIISKSTNGNTRNSSLEYLNICFNEAVDKQLLGLKDAAEVTYMNILESLPIVAQTCNNLADLNKDKNYHKAVIFSEYATMVFPESHLFQITKEEVLNVNKKPN